MFEDRYAISDIRYPLSDIRHRISDIRYPISDAQATEPPQPEEPEEPAEPAAEPEENPAPFNRLASTEVLQSGPSRLVKVGVPGIDFRSHLDDTSPGRADGLLALDSQLDYSVFHDRLPRPGDRRALLFLLDEFLRCARAALV